MQTIEMIIFAVTSVIAVLAAFDFIVYVVKSAPKSSFFAKRVWYLGMLATMVLVYWFVNGYKFV